MSIEENSFVPVVPKRFLVIRDSGSELLVRDTADTSSGVYMSLRGSHIFVYREDLEALIAALQCALNDPECGDDRRS